MILRRVTEHVRRQDWTAILIDLLIVVVGVFIGIQVSNWNEDRSDRALEATYLASLAEDVRSDIEEIDTTIAVSTWRMSVLEALVFRAPGETVPVSYEIAGVVRTVNPAPPFTDAESRSVGLATIYIRTIDGNRSTYETLLNTGGIGLLRDTALLRHVQRYYAAVDELQDTEKGLLVIRDDMIAALHQAGLSPLDERNLAELSAALGKDPRLIASAKTFWGASNNQISVLKALRRQSQALAEEIERKIQR